MFRGFASGCGAENANWQLQLSALSSYARIRIWKIDPYEYCPIGPDDTPNCASGHVAKVDIPDSFLDVYNDTGTVFDYRKCVTPFSVAVTGLEYLNEGNIAVTILYAPFSEYNPLTGVLSETSTIAYYRIMFLNTVQMRLSDTPWNREVLDVELNQGKICPGMRQLPNVGSMFMEVISSYVNLFRPIVSVVVAIPGLVELWGAGRKCALDTQGHSLLQSCGSEVLSLRDFFDSTNRANTLFWSGFNNVAYAIRGMGQTHLANIVDGVAYHGDATSAPLGASMIINAVRIPTADIGGMITR
jgi:hypothetical protein